MLTQRGDTTVQHSSIRRLTRRRAHEIKQGDRVAVLDSFGVTWFGIAVTGVERDSGWPEVRVLIGSRPTSFPARDVCLWPTPETLAEHRRMRLAQRDVEGHQQLWPRHDQPPLTRSAG